MKCNFCDQPSVVLDEQLQGFIIERNGRRPLCKSCAKVIFMAVAQRIADNTFGWS